MKREEKVGRGLVKQGPKIMQKNEGVEGDGELGTCNVDGLRFAEEGRWRVAHDRGCGNDCCGMASPGRPTGSQRVLPSGLEHHTRPMPPQPRPIHNSKIFSPKRPSHEYLQNFVILLPSRSNWIAFS